MVVLMIIGLIGSFVFMNLMPVAEGAKVTAAKTQMANFKSVLFKYKMDNGSYPTTQQGLQSLVQMPQTEPIPKNYQQGGYLESKRVPLDPWGNNYVYEFPDPDNPDRYLMKSLGSDGKEGGEGTSKDIKSEE
jgi:general secretion pathway protein G